jgi:hypothetical protein
MQCGGAVSGDGDTLGRRPSTGGTGEQAERTGGRREKKGGEKRREEDRGGEGSETEGGAKAPHPFVSSGTEHPPGLTACVRESCRQNERREPRDGNRIERL